MEERFCFENHGQEEDTLQQAKYQGQVDVPHGTLNETRFTTLIKAKLKESDNHIITKFLFLLNIEILCLLYVLNLIFLRIIIPKITSTRYIFYVKNKHVGNGHTDILFMIIELLCFLN